MFGAHGMALFDMNDVSEFLSIGTLISVWCVVLSAVISLVLWLFIRTCRKGDEHQDRKGHETESLESYAIDNDKFDKEQSVGRVSDTVSTNDQTS